MEWQDISTAPKDGRDILVADARSKEVLSASWVDNCWFIGWMNYASRSDGYQVNATHWMPLPAAPEV